jgi:hypothetical protein
VETSASFEARYAPLSYPTAGAISDGRPYRDSYFLDDGHIWSMEGAEESVQS